MIRRVLLWGPPLLYASLIFHLSSESNPLPELTSLVWDKALHLSEYAGLALLLCRACRGEGMRWSAAIASAVLLASAYASTDEWHQRFVPARQSDVLDWLADTIGATVGAGVYRLIDPILALGQGRYQP
jgi:VanZ family protein